MTDRTKLEIFGHILSYNYIKCMYELRDKIVYHGPEELSLDL